MNGRSALVRPPSSGESRGTASLSGRTPCTNEAHDDAREDRDDQRRSLEATMATAVKQYQMFVGGEWVPAASGETLTIISPATGDTIAEVPSASAEDVNRAIAYA